MYPLPQKPGAGELWRLSPSPHLIIKAAAGWKTVILLIAFKAAKPPGQQSHLEK